MPNLTGYAYSQKISVTGNKPAVSQSWFPAYIKFESDTNIASYTQNQGLDIAFTLDGDDTELPYEVELWNQDFWPPDPAAVADIDIWVRVPSVDSASDTNLRMYVGKVGGTRYATPSDVWSENGASDYTGVYHYTIPAATLPTVPDSTAYGNDGTNSGTADSPTAMVASARTYSVHDYISMPKEVLPGKPFTFTSWVRRTANGRYHVTDTNSAGNLLVQQSAGVAFFSAWCGGKSTGNYSPFAVDTYYHSAIVQDSATTATVYVDGVAKGTILATAFAALTTPVYVGNNLADNRGYIGHIDEPRFAKTDRSVEWLLFEYKNIADYSNTITHGAWAAPSAVAPVVGADANPTDDAFPDTCDDEFSNVIVIPEADFTLVDNCDFLEAPDAIFEADLTGYNMGSHGGSATTKKSGLMPVNLYFSMIDSSGAIDWADSMIYVLRFVGTSVPFSTPLPKSKVVFASASLYDTAAEGTGNGNGLLPGAKVSIQLKQTTFADVLTDADADAWTNIGHPLQLFNTVNVALSDWRPDNPVVANRDVALGNMIGGHLTTSTLSGTPWTTSSGSVPGYPSTSKNFYVIVTAYLETA
jgi:hypothetical protein